MSAAPRGALRRRPLPEWYNRARFGIFVHWGLYSVPAWAPTSIGDFISAIREKGFEEYFRSNPYGEWYLNGLRMPNSPARRHHDETWGPAWPYERFKDLFNEGLGQWSPDAWADAFLAAGARYVVLVAKHHDGFCLWPSAVRNPHIEGYHSSRDVVGELSEAVRARGMRMGVYYSGSLDWTFTSVPIRSAADLLTNGDPSQQYADYANAQYRELIDRYAPSILWNDIGYPARGRLPELLAYYRSRVPDGVVNDRWVRTGDPMRKALQKPAVRALVSHVARHGILSHRTVNPGIPVDFTTLEYAVSPKVRRQKWECGRGIGNSFGYTQNEKTENHLTAQQAVRMLREVVAANGNLLLNVGPMPGGTIPEAQLECLRGMGEWLAQNRDTLGAAHPPFVFPLT